MNRIHPDKQFDGLEHPAPPFAKGKEVLCYADQVSFMGLRALGRQPIIHFNWVFPHSLDESVVEQFNERLAQGLLGRLLQRSPLPWGRHRWVANTVPAPVTWFRDPIPPEALPTWRSSLMDLSVDPECGPGWRLVVQSLSDGGTALSLLISHTLADGTAAIQAISDAVADRKVTPGFPAASTRWSLDRLVRDSLESTRALPDVWRALKTMSRAKGTKHRHTSVGPTRLRRPRHEPLESVVSIPLVYVAIDKRVCDKRAEHFGVKINTLLTAFAARLAFQIGRVDATGHVELVLPVSDRRLGDWRGNALQAVTLRVDPHACLLDLPKLQRERRSLIDSVLRNGHELSALLPLVPYLPLWLVRHLEKQVVSGDISVGCSFYVEFPTELTCPFGEVSFFQLSSLERFTTPALNRLGGRLQIVFYRLGRSVNLSISCYTQDCITSHAELVPCVKEALADLGISATVS